jgi:hypothetical protein
VLGHLLLSINQQSFLEWTHSSLEQSLEEFYTILLVEHLQVVVEMLNMGISSSLPSPKLTRVVQRCSNVLIVLDSEDVEVHLHALIAMTEQLQLCELGHFPLGKLHRCSEIMSGS